MSSQQQPPQFPPPPQNQPPYGGQPPPQKNAAWEKAKVEGKKWFDRVGVPVNSLTNKLGAESFWPTSLDKEADKAARILRSFCIDGFVAGHDNQPGKPDPKKKKDRIPAKVIQNARGLAIFTVMRTGLHWSGAGGSGVVVSRLPNGQWSAPSGILIHTLGIGFIAGVDIYDCVCVINNEHGMEGFTSVRCTLGGEVSAAVGPLGAGAQLDSEVVKRQAPVWTYTKGRGLYIGVQVDGTVIVERTSENERFYHVEKVKNAQILNGQIWPPPGSCVQLWETLQACSGQDHNPSLLPPPYTETPGDYQVNAPRDVSQQEYSELGHYDNERMDMKS